MTLVQTSNAHCFTVDKIILQHLLTKSSRCLSKIKIPVLIETISLLIIITISLNTQIDKFVYRFGLETTILAYFPPKSLNYTAIILFLQKLSALTISKFTISTRTDVTLQTSVKYLRAITMCSAFTPDCGYDKSTINLIGDLFCPNTECSGKLCMHKKTFQSLGGRD